MLCSIMSETQELETFAQPRAGKRRDVVFEDQDVGVFGSLRDGAKTAIDAKVFGRARIADACLFRDPFVFRGYCVEVNEELARAIDQPALPVRLQRREIVCNAPKLRTPTETRDAGEAARRVSELGPSRTSLLIAIEHRPRRLTPGDGLSNLLREKMQRKMAVLVRPAFYRFPSTARRDPAKAGEGIFV